MQHEDGRYQGSKAGNASRGERYNQEPDQILRVKRTFRRAEESEVFLSQMAV